MNTPSQGALLLRRALEHPNGGVVGLVDDLLRVCRELDVQLDWQEDCWRLRSRGGNWEELPGVGPRKSVLRAILARLAALCNEHVPNSVSPYGGQGELPLAADPPAIARIVFANTPTEQKLELTVESEAVANTLHGRPGQTAEAG